MYCNPRTRDPALKPHPVRPSPVRHPAALRVAISEQLLYRNMQRFRGGLVFKAHRPLYHSTLGLRLIKKRIRETEGGFLVLGRGRRARGCPSWETVPCLSRLDSRSKASGSSSSGTCETSRSRSPSCKSTLLPVMCSGSEAGSYLRLIDFCITQL